MEGGPPRPRRRNDGRRAANRSSDRGIASKPVTPAQIRPSGEEAGRGRTGPRARRRGGVTAPGHLMVGAPDNVEKTGVWSIGQPGFLVVAAEAEQVGRASCRERV